MNSELVVSAYAKINLTLDVLARRPDGYHDIRSVMQTVALHDTLGIIRTPVLPGVTLDVLGEEAAGVPNDASNIVHRAAVRLQKIGAARGTVPPHQSGLRIILTKRIPSQAGLGGGSSDAAATLRAINTLFGLDLTIPRLSEIAASLGADVPFFLTGGTTLVEGLGERVTPLPSLESDWRVVIVRPPVGVSTADAYAALDADPARSIGDATARWLAGNPLALGNDFEDTVLAAHPAVRRAHEALAGGAGPPPLLCGSGAALFRLVPDAETAHVIADRVQAAGVGRTWITEIQKRSE